MWDRHFTTPPFAMVEIALDTPLEPLVFAEGINGAHVLVRFRDRPVGRFWLSRALHGDVVPIDTLQTHVDHVFDAGFGAAFLDDLAPARTPEPAPAITIAICTRDRPALLRRCLEALVERRDQATRAAVDLVVVDNAPSDSGTRDAVADFPSVRYVVEPVPGLNFGRNRALAEAKGDWLGFIDDDAIPDRGWLDALIEGIADSPTAGGFAGPIMPMMLETEAQMRFERSGGFGKGFQFKRFARERYGDPFHPTGQGNFGTGASMVFSAHVMREIGGFDEALDTGPPLPGGGDSDSFYRVIRAGHPVIYLPGLMVHHEHRRDMPGLRKQYHSWGLSNGALLGKTKARDPQMFKLQRRTLATYVVQRAKRLVFSLAGRGPLTPRLNWAELAGALAGCLGEYERSQKRVSLRKAEKDA